MDLLEQLETKHSKCRDENFPFFLNGQTLALSQSRPFPLELGPFSFPKSIAVDILHPKAVLPQKNWVWKPQIEFHANPTKAAISFALGRDLLTGETDMSQITEIQISKSVKNAKNSTSFEREPAHKSDFVRGKSTFYPFAPGGVPFMNNIINQNDNDISLKDDKDKLLLAIPPGFDRGMNCGKKQMLEQNSTEFVIDNKIISFKDTLDKDEKKNQEFSLKDNSCQILDHGTEEKDVDAILQIGAKPALAPVSLEAPGSTLKEWAHVIDVNLPFDEFHSLVYSFS